MTEFIKTHAVQVRLSHARFISSKKMTAFEKTVIIDKAQINVSFSPHDHIRKVLNSINQMSELDTYIDYFNKTKTTVTSESKKNIRGHDFVDLLYHFVNKIKNDIDLSLETLERLIFQCIDFSKLKEEPLFKYLIAKYTT